MELLDIRSYDFGVVIVEEHVCVAGVSELKSVLGVEDGCGFGMYHSTCSEELWGEVCPESGRWPGNVVW